jgi:hypothetical protein
MDSFTILRFYEQTVQKYMSDYSISDQQVDVSSLLSAISNVLYDMCKKMDAHKVLLISDKGNMSIVESMNSPIPEDIKSKRFMKTNTRSATKDIMKVLLILLGINMAGTQCTIREYTVLYHFIMWFIFENEEWVSVASVHEFCLFIKKQFIHGPSFVEKEKWNILKEERMNQFYSCDKVQVDYTITDKIKEDIQSAQDSILVLHNTNKIFMKDVSESIQLLVKQIAEQKELYDMLQSSLVDHKYSIDTSLREEIIAIIKEEVKGIPVQCELSDKGNPFQCELSDNVKSELSELSELSDKVTKVQSELVKVTQSQCELSEKMSQVQGELSEKMSQVQGELSYKFTQSQNELSEKVTQVQDEISEKVSKSQSELSEKVSQSQSELYEKVSQSQSELYEKVSQIQTDLSDKFTQSQSELSDKFTQSQSELSEKVSQSQSELSEKVSQVQTDLSEKVSQVQTDLSEKVTQIKGEISEKVSQFQSELSEKVSQVQTDLSEKVTQIKGEISEKVNQVQGELSEKVNQVQGELSDKVSQVQGELSEKVSQVQGELSDKVNQVQGELSDKVSQVQGELSDKVNQVQGELSDKVNQVQGELSDKVNQVQGELSDKVSQVQGELSNKVQNDILYNIQTELITKINDIQQQIVSNYKKTNIEINQLSEQLRMACEPINIEIESSNSITVHEINHEPTSEHIVEEKKDNDHVSTSEHIVEEKIESDLDPTIKHIVEEIETTTDGLVELVVPVPSSNMDEHTLMDHVEKEEMKQEYILENNVENNLPMTIEVHTPHSDSISIHEVDTEEEVEVDSTIAPILEKKVSTDITAETEAPMIIDPESVSASTSEDHDMDSDIQIIKHGNYYMIYGTRVVINSTTCQAIGYLDEQFIFHSECNEYVQKICDEYDIEFQ